MNYKFEIPEFKGAGVYVIINKTTGMCYVGQSEDIYMRFRVHKRLLKTRKHYCKNLQADYDNGCRFKCLVLKEISRYDRHRLLMYEDYFIMCLRSRDVKLYNTDKHNQTANDFFIRASQIDENVSNILTYTKK